MSEAATETTTDGGRRGRPRPPEVEARDLRVVELLTEGPKTRNQLTEVLGVKPGIAYLSIYRLRREGRVEKVRVQVTENNEDGTTATRNRDAWKLI